MRNVALLGTRLVLGGYLAVHGAQKLFGAFGGSGLDRAAAGCSPHRPAAGQAHGHRGRGHGAGRRRAHRGGDRRPGPPAGHHGGDDRRGHHPPRQGTAELQGRVRAPADQPGRRRHAGRGGAGQVPPRSRAAPAGGRGGPGGRRAAGRLPGGQDADGRTRAPGRGPGPGPGGPARHLDPRTAQQRWNLSPRRGVAAYTA